ncbi:MAG TPA: tRNA (adenosine(37)-N6)-dimethylallyltransferase MiaA [Planctomycetaceae bacterium]|nr:tRNA (adenosine(37)-N6)-dimethylallyltransferase MiaA [Planctomycetaceae bacterium]
MQIPHDLLSKCWFLAGPTAVGKTQLALLLAARLDAEILSLDSMAIYREMDVGTAKPTLAEQNQIPHQLIDIVDPWQEFSVADYLALAHPLCEQILARGKVPLFVGGTGMYLRALLRGVFEGPEGDPQLRAELEAHYEEIGGERFHAELQSVDPAAAEKIHPRDIRRLVRAREVIELTGKPFSSFHQEQPLPEQLRPRHVYWLSPPREWLYERINLRVDRMIEAGLLDEIETLQNLPHPLSKTARQAIGYKELLDALEAGSDIEAAIELIKTRSRQFAKRQHTWFRNLEECRSIDLDPAEELESLANRLLDG